MPLREWATEICEGALAVAEQIDRGGQGGDYQAAVSAQLEAVADTDATPSARILTDLRDQNLGFYHYAMQRARDHREYFASLAPLSPERQSMFEDEARRSLERQAEIEAADSIGFDEYLAAYYAS